MSDFIELTLDDEQSGDSFGLPDSPVCAIQQAADGDSFCESDSEYPLVKSEPADLSDTSSVVIVSNDSTSDLRYVIITKYQQRAAFMPVWYSCRLHVHHTVMMMMI